MDPKKIMDALNSREEDSKRLNEILETLKNSPVTLQVQGGLINFDHEFSVFEVRSLTDTKVYNVFRDGRQAIDFCLNDFEVETVVQDEVINY